MHDKGHIITNEDLDDLFKTKPIKEAPIKEAPIKEALIKELDNSNKQKDESTSNEKNGLTEDWVINYWTHKNLLIRAAFRATIYCSMGIVLVIVAYLEIVGCLILAAIVLFLLLA